MVKDSLVDEGMTNFLDGCSMLTESPLVLSTEEEDAFKEFRVLVNIDVPVNNQTYASLNDLSNYGEISLSKVCINQVDQIDRHKNLLFGNFFPLKYGEVRYIYCNEDFYNTVLKTDAEDIDVYLDDFNLILLLGDYLYVLGRKDKLGKIEKGYLKYNVEEIKTLYLKLYMIVQLLEICHMIDLPHMDSAERKKVRDSVYRKEGIRLHDYKSKFKKRIIGGVEKLYMGYIKFELNQRCSQAEYITENF